MRVVTLIAWWCAFPAVALAQAPDPSSMLAKGGAPPRIGIVDGVRDGKLLVRDSVLVMKQGTRQRPVMVKVLVDGVEQEKTQMVPETFTFTESVPKIVEHELSGVRVFDTKGQPIPTDRLARLYERPGLALFAPANLKIDPVYLRVARDGVPLIVLPPPPMPAAAGRAGAPSTDPVVSPATPSAPPTEAAPAPPSPN